MAETSTAGTRPALVCENLASGWGETQVIDGLTLSVAEGETVAVLGRNGVGKTTLLSTIMGRARQNGGRLDVFGEPMGSLSIHRRSRMGIGLVPQEREIFPSLTVLENLQVSRRPGGWTLERVHDLFPRLRERRAHLGSHLSGGEQQMLAIARALMGAPRLLMLDEPMEGLAPVIVEQLITAIGRIRAETGMTLLLVEQHAHVALALASRVVVLDRGRLVYDNGPDAPPDAAAIEALIALKAGAA